MINEVTIPLNTFPESSIFKKGNVKFLSYENYDMLIIPEYAPKL